MAARIRLVDRTVLTMRLGVVEAKLLPARVTLTFTIVALLLAAVAAIQEVPALRRSGPTLLASAGDAAVALATLMLPAAWLMARGPGAQPWVDRHSRWPWVTAVASWCGCMSAVALGVAGVAVAFGLVGVLAETPGIHATRLVAAVANLPALAAMAQPIAASPLRPARGALVWLCLAATSAGFGLPVPWRFSIGPSPVDPFEPVWCLVLAHGLVIVGGLLGARAMMRGLPRG